MKQLICAFCLLLLFGCNRQAADIGQTINPILGNASFISRYGNAPDKLIDDDLRIKTHLEYVENLLRQKDCSNLTPELQQKRKHLLDLLHQYWTNGIFPRNYDFAGERKPCFIDKDNRICAVGYLVEQTAGREVAQAINSKHKYDLIMEMNDVVVDSWINSSGFTKEEAAMIQPTYEGKKTNTLPLNVTATGILSYGNAALNTFNIIHIVRGSEKKLVPIMGLFTGTTQLVLGMATYSPDDDKTEQTLSFINIGMGATTLVLSNWNLINNKKPKEKLTTWNIYTYPATNNEVGVGFCITRKL